MIYYHITQSKIFFSCQRCQGKSDLCEGYIFERIIRHIKAFDVKQESNVFKQVRANLLNQDNQLELDTNAKEIVVNYNNKIIKEYEEKSLNFDIASTLIENAILEMEEDIQKLVDKKIARYKAYTSPIVLKDFIFQSLNYKKNETVRLQKLILIELLNKEKFNTYIRPIVESRFIDFVRSKQYKDEMEEDIKGEDALIDTNRVTENYKINLNVLSNEQKMLYKLKHAIRLDNREFLTITYKLNYLDTSILDSFTPEEKLYLKFSISYEVMDDSTHFSMFDVKSINKSISKKISEYREKLQSHSYKEEQEEIFIKLIYTEPLSAKEMGIVFNLTSKQIDKKVENIKKRLLKLEKIS